MKPIARKDGRFEVRIPRKLSGSGKIESRYFPSRSQALKFISGFKSERREHGKGAVTAEGYNVEASRDAPSHSGLNREVAEAVHRRLEQVQHVQADSAAFRVRQTAPTGNAFVLLRRGFRLRERRT